MQKLRAFSGRVMDDDEHEHVPDVHLTKTIIDLSACGMKVAKDVDMDMYQAA